MGKEKSPKNKTITLTEDEKVLYNTKLYKPNNINSILSLDSILNKTINYDLISLLDYLPPKSVDLLFLDPPYNLGKKFNEFTFNKMSDSNYLDYLRTWFPKIINTLKDTGSLYLCGDWKSSPFLYLIIDECGLKLRSRITWGRDKGRGAKSNYKNNIEDVYFATKSDNYTFNVDDIKIKKNVIAPYRNKDTGENKDWTVDESGNKYRMTHLSNFWSDIVIPFWSMPENTEHPTQKPEQLLERLIKASSNKGDVVLDCFLGSGTTSVVSKKLERNYIGIDMDNYYCCVAEKRLNLLV